MAICSGGCGGTLDRRNKTGICRKCQPITGAAGAAQAAKTPAPTEKFETKPNGSAELTLIGTSNPRTLAELVAACQIDLDVWEIERWVANKWEMGYKDADKSAHTKPLFQIKVWLKPISRQVTLIKELGAQLLEDLSQAVPPVLPYPVAQPERKGYLFEFAPFDLHVGKLAWDQETFTNYDGDIAEQLLDQAFDALLTGALNYSSNSLERILIVIGNDVSHIDTKRAQTTAGTQMDVDTRWIKIFRKIVRMHRRVVDKALIFAPVDIVVVPGNHDEQTAFTIGEVLTAAYESNPRVTINNDPKLRKYYQYGVNLLGFTHGDKEKVLDLPLIMAREKPEAWANSSEREWHIGHKHIKEQWTWKTQDIHSEKGVRVRRLPSLSAHDAWHVANGYMDRRACEGFVFHRDSGHVATLSFNIDHFTGEGMK